MTITPERLDRVSDEVLSVWSYASSRQPEIASMARELTRLRALEACVREAGEALEDGAEALDWYGDGTDDVETREWRHGNATALRRLRTMVTP